MDPSKFRSGTVCHYGVLGMKWGVHKNPSKAFGKATRKADRLNRRVDRAVTKVSRKEKKLARVNRSYTGIGFAGVRDVGHASANYYKAQKKLLKRQNKAKKWIGAMETTFANTKVSEISQKDLALGKQYIYMLTNA